MRLSDGRQGRRACEGRPARREKGTLPRVSGPEVIPPSEAFLAQAAEAGIEFDAGDLERFGKYLGLLLDSNTRFNLTAVRDPGEAWVRHVLDSLTLIPLLVEAGASRESGAEGPLRVVDVGSGGGAPGLILAIAMPDASFTLVEATGKKANFLREAAQALGLANVEVVAERAETLGQDRNRWRERFDAATARAVGSVAEAAELTVPLVRIGGLVLLTKGRRAAEEIEEAKQALHMLHASVAGVVETPTGKVVVIEKRRATPRTYPRRPGEPKRSPLGVGPKREGEGQERGEDRGEG